MSLTAMKKFLKRYGCEYIGTMKINGVPVLHQYNDPWGSTKSIGKRGTHEPF
jgi:hypothetical protein